MKTHLSRKVCLFARCLTALACLEGALTQAQTRTEQDLMVGYTKAARDSRGGAEQIIAQIRQGIINTNVAMQRSQARATVVERMIGEFTIGDGGRNIGAMLGEWRRKRGGNSFGQSQAYWENELGIDFAMIVSNVSSSNNGEAENTGTYSSIKASRITQPTFAHELGHNYGCTHRGGRENFNVPGQGLRATLLKSRGRSYGGVINNYSNPNVNFGGVPTGTPNNNNAGRINERMLGRQNVRPRNNNPSPSDPRRPVTVDTSLQEYNYDFGTLISPVFPSWTRISPETNGDISWSGEVLATDRGSANVNEANRDLVYSSNTRTLSHKIANGTWAVLLNMGDRDYAHNNMRVSAEGGQVVRSNISNNRGQFPAVEFNVNVSDGRLDLEFSDVGSGDPNWVVNRMRLTKLAAPPVIVDTSRTKYDYDFGTPDSPVFSGWTRISPETKGDISWSGGVLAVDRGSANVNAANRDLVYSSNNRTLRHKIANGTWSVYLNMGDRDYAHNNMRVSAEGGQVVRSNINNAAGQFTAVSFNVNVTDGRLDLEFSDVGNGDPNWVVTRLSLTKVNNPSPGNIVVDTGRTRYDYDFGTPTSPVFSGWTRISPITNGDISWSGGVLAVDRGSANVNAANRDLVYSSNNRTLRHRIANGTWSVYLNMGDRDYPHNNMRVSAEGGQVVRSNINNAAGQFTGVGFNVNVSDGRLDLEFSDVGSGDPNWVVTRLTLTRVTSAEISSDGLAATAPAEPAPSTTASGSGISGSSGSAIDVGSLVAANVYRYDFGTPDSPLQSGYTRVSELNQQGYYRWNSSASGITSTDSSSGGSSPDLLRDFNGASSAQTFVHQVENGEWEIKLSFFDPDAAHNDIFVRAEGLNVATNIDVNAGQLVERTVTATVSDGELNLQIDSSGADWILNGLVLTKQTATGNLTVGTTVYLKGNNGRYVTSGSPMTCNSTTTGSAQEFLVVDGGNGTIAFRSSANQYVSSENGNGPINSNRSSVGSWEQFTVDNLGNQTISIKGNNNRYVSSENGNNPMTCNRTAVGSWERFTWEAK